MPSNQNPAASAPIFPGNVLLLHATSQAGFLAEMPVSIQLDQGIYLWLFSPA